MNEWHFLCCFRFYKCFYCSFMAASYWPSQDKKPNNMQFVLCVPSFFGDDSFYFWQRQVVVTFLLLLPKCVAMALWQTAVPSKRHSLLYVSVSLLLIIICKLIRIAGTAFLLDLACNILFICFCMCRRDFLFFSYSPSRCKTLSNCHFKLPFKIFMLQPLKAEVYEVACLSLLFSQRPTKLCRMLFAQPFVCDI